MQFRQAVADALGENVEIGCGAGLAGDAEGELAEVGEDRDGDLDEDGALVAAAPYAVGYGALPMGG